MMCVYIPYFRSILVLLTDVDLTNISQPMIKSDRPPHLTSPRRGEGFFFIFAGRWARDEGVYVKIIDLAIMCDFAITLRVTGFIW